MKRHLFAYLISCILLISTIPKVQARTIQNQNISAQPVWGPEGYDRADYYYLPDMECYYSIATHQFIYLSGGRWIYAANLPRNYAHYDLFSGYKVVLNTPRPYLNLDRDRVEYIHYLGYHGHQVSIRDSRNPKYMRRVGKH